MQYIIESGIPLPAGRDNELEDALRRLRVDQSILDPTKRSAAIWRDRANKLGIKIKCIRQSCGHYRIWRIE